MKKIILAAMSAGILSGCSSSPPLATPKGDFEDLNTDITTLLPPVQAVYAGAKSVPKSLPLSPNHGMEIAKSVTSKNVTKESGFKPIVKPTSVPSSKPNKSTELKVPVVPVATTAKNSDTVTIGKSQGGSLSNKTSPRNPFADAKNASLTNSLTNNLLKSETLTDPKKDNKQSSVIQTKVVPTQPILKSWGIKKGMSLQSAYTEWVSKEKCTLAKGWEIRWETETDYPIDYPLTFSAVNFEDATNQLFKLYRKATIPLYVNGYRNQCLIIVSDKNNL